MREILFRAKAINRDNGYRRTTYKNGDWVYGLISRPYKEMFPTLPMEFRNENGVYGIEVDYKTVGQFTGLTDKKGKKIFEGDIVTVNGVANATIIYNDNEACFSFDYGENGRPLIVDLVEEHSIEVIGNIHDNKEKQK